MPVSLNTCGVICRNDVDRLKPLRKFDTDLSLTTDRIVSSPDLILSPRPMSKEKRWRVAEILAKAEGLDAAKPAEVKS